MKYGMRKPSVKKSIKARTTGQAKRAVKKAVVPGYGKKGSGWVKDPKKAAYNKVYNKTTFGVNDIYKGSSHSCSSSRTYSDNIQPDSFKTSFLEIHSTGVIKISFILSCRLCYWGRSKRDHQT